MLRATTPPPTSTERPPRRRPHRRASSPHARYGLTARLVFGEGSLQVRLDTISFEGARVAVDRRHGAPLRPGQGVSLRLLAPGCDALEVPAVVDRHFPGRDRTEYDLRFTSPLQRYVPSRLVGAFNRRRAFRVSPDSSAPVVARVETAHGGSVRLPLICLSATGCALLARRPEEQPLRAGDRVRLTFSFPGATAPVDVEATVRYGAAQRQGTRYGLELDAAAAGFARHQRRIQRYVMEQQRRMLALAR